MDKSLEIAWLQGDLPNSVSAFHLFTKTVIPTKILLHTQRQARRKTFYPGLLWTRKLGPSPPVSIYELGSFLPVGRSSSRCDIIFWLMLVWYSTHADFIFCSVIHNSFWNRHSTSKSTEWGAVRRDGPVVPTSIRWGWNSSSESKPLPTNCGQTIRRRNWV